MTRKAMRQACLRRRTFLQRHRCQQSALLSTSARTSHKAASRKNKTLYAEIECIAPTAAPAGLSSKKFRKPEVLAPAGGWPQLHAAIQNGADAVYFGLTAFNARARADNFTLQELHRVVNYAHERGVRTFVTLNILIFDRELKDLEEFVRAIAATGVDSVIVQDVGAVELIRRIAPNLAIHASTQMSITSGEGAEFARDLGCKRVVVGRELSVEEIAKTVAKTAAEVEVFVHGALCVSYSGQCFSSEAWGGRSANRGQCAQACRLPYGMLVNGVLKELGDIKYLLSPQDLMALEQVPALIEAGVSCFKIEGRLKGPEYVAVTTKAYREAVDTAWGVMTDESARGGLQVGMSMSSIVKGDTLQDLQQVFARGQDEVHAGLTPGFLEGPKHQRLVRGRNPRHRGVYIGRVSHVHQSTVYVEAQAALREGDGVVFDCGKPDAPEHGGTIAKLASATGKPQLASNGIHVKGIVGMQIMGLDVDKVRRGDIVWKSKDPSLEGRLRSTYEKVAAAKLKRVPISASLSGLPGQRAVLHLEVRNPALIHIERI